MKIYTLDDLFDLQLDNVSCLNSELEAIINESTARLSNLERYYSELYRDFRQAEIASSEVAGSMGIVKARYDKLHSSGIKAEFGTSEYVEHKINLAKARKSVDNHLQSYVLSKEALEDIAGEVDFLSGIEPVFRMSVHFCERMERRIRRLERHLHAVKDIYRYLQLHKTALSYLSDSVEFLSRFTYEVNLSFAEGIRSIADIANNRHSLDVPEFAPLLSEIHSVEMKNAVSADVCCNEIESKILNAVKGSKMFLY